MGRFRWLAAVAGSFFLCGSASAVVIGFSPPSSTVALGSRFGVDIVVSELSGPAGAEIVSAFDLDVLYDQSFLRGVDFQFSDALGIANVDTFADGWLTAGRFDLANISLLANADLFALQGDNVVLGRLVFDAIGVGLSTLEFETNGAAALNLVGSNPFASLAFTDIGTGFIDVTTAVSVDEPSTWTLSALALLLLVSYRRKRLRAHAEVAHS
jgi:hypothetical protein